MNKKENMNEVAPPGSSGSVRAMITKHGYKFDPKAKGKGKKMNPYAIAWSQHNKGAEWHYKEKGDKDTTKGKVPEKKEKFKDEDKPKKKKKKGKLKSFKEWAQDRESKRPNLTEGVAKVSSEDIAALTPFQLAKKVKNLPRPEGMGPLAYAVMLKMKQEK